MKNFVSESENYEENHIETLNTALFTVVFKEFEKDIFLWMLISHDSNLNNDYTTQTEKNLVLYNDIVS